MWICMSDACYHVTRSSSMAFCNMLPTHTQCSTIALSQMNVSDYINHWKSNFQTKASVYNTSDHWTTDASPNLAPCSSWVQGKFHTFSFNVMRDYFFGLAFKWSRLVKTTHLCSICISPKKDPWSAIFLLKHMADGFQPFCMQKYLTLTWDKNQWAWLHSLKTEIKRPFG